MESKKHNCILFIGCLFAAMALLTSGVSANAESMSIVTLSVLNQNPSPALAGDTVDVRMGVENFGGEPVKDLVLEVVPSYPFSIVDMTTSMQELGDLSEKQANDHMKVAKFKAHISKDVSAGTYMLKIRRYERGYEDKAVIFNFPVDVKGKESAEIIFIDKIELIPGQVSPLTFTITNVGNAPLRDLVFSWSNSDKVVLPVGSDNTRQIRYLDVDESVELAYKVIADPSASSGLYPLDLRLQYLDTINGTQKTIATGAGIYVGGGTDFDVSFTQSSSGQTSFTVANIGSNSAYSVSVIVPEQAGWNVKGSNNVIIGNLNTGDYTIATYALSAAGSASMSGTGATSSRTAGSRTTTTATDGTDAGTSSGSAQTPSTLTIQIHYTDTKGMRQTVDKVVKLSPSDLSASQTTAATAAARTSVWSSYQWYIVGAIIIVLVFFGWRAYSRRSREKALAGTDKKKR